MTPKVYATRLSGYSAITMSAAEDAAFPMANLLDYNPTVEWKHSANGSTLPWVQVNFGRQVLVNFMVVDTHNLDVVGYKLQYSGDGAFGSPVEIVAANTPGDNLPLVKEFSALAAWTMRITFQQGAQVPRIGNLFFGKMFQFQYPFDIGGVEGDGQFSTNVTTSIGGVTRTSQPYADRRVWEYQWSPVDNSEAADIKLLHAYVRGKSIPMYLLYGEQFLPVLVFLESDYNPVPRGAVYNLNKTSKMRFVEWLAEDRLSRYDQYAGQMLVGDIPLVGE